MNCSVFHTVASWLCNHQGHGMLHTKLQHGLHSALANQYPFYKDMDSLKQAKRNFLLCTDFKCKQSPSLQTHKAGWLIPSLPLGTLLHHPVAQKQPGKTFTGVRTQVHFPNHKAAGKSYN